VTLSIRRNREATDPKLHFAIDTEARTMLSAEVRLPYLGGLSIVLRRTHATELDDSAPTQPEG
jgi:hypothetical protein